MRTGTMLVIGCLLGDVIFVVTSTLAGPPDEAPKTVTSGSFGLTVREDGVLLKDGRPFRGIGVNYYDAFLRHLRNPKDTSYRAGFEALARAQIPFVRFAGCAFWPSQQKLYQENPKEFFSRFDDVVKSAEEHGIGLVPSFFWAISTVPDLVGEPVNQWGNPQSKTHEHLRNYVRNIVTRYRHSPAIWGWEFGNEFNLVANLPNAAEHRPFVNVRKGTPPSRDVKDELTYEAIRIAFTAFAREVRKYDADRVISTGNSIPRPAAWHNWKENNYAADTAEQFAEMLRDDNPDPVDLVSIHLYDVSKQVIDDAADRSRRLKKPLFVGEFGAIGPNDERGKFRMLLAAIEEAKVPLAALWVYDFSGQDADWNVTWTNDRSYQLSAIAEANARIRMAFSTETKDAFPQRRAILTSGGNRSSWPGVAF